MAAKVWGKIKTGWVGRKRKGGREGGREKGRGGEDIPPGEHDGGQGLSKVEHHPSRTVEGLVGGSGGGREGGRSRDGRGGGREGGEGGDSFLVLWQLWREGLKEGGREGGKEGRREEEIRRRGGWGGGIVMREREGREGGEGEEGKEGGREKEEGGREGGRAYIPWRHG